MELRSSRWRVDPQARIEFYIERGVLSRAPTVDQLHRAELIAACAAGPRERLRSALREPLGAFGLQRRRALLRVANAEIAAHGHVPSSPSTQDPAAQPALDRLLRALFLFAPLRFLANCAVNPFYLRRDTGLSVPSSWLIEHLLSSPHPSALWDLQILAADPGGLDAFERRLEECSRGNGLRARAYRALAQRDGYYDYLRQVCARVRRFDYPPTPPGFVPRFENLVTYLEFAASC